MAKTAKQLAKDALAKQTARKIAKVKKRPTPLKEPKGMSAKAAPLTPNKRMGSAYDATTPLPRKSGKAKKGYSINNVMCGHTRKK
jgi:hypothetical protein